MTKKLTSLLAVLIVLFGFISCSDNGNNDIEVTLNNVTANGSVIDTTTQLIITFSQEIIGLSANDITLSGVDGITKGSLSNTGAAYTLGISGFTESGTLNVAVSKTGFNISGSPKTVGVFYDPILKSAEMQVCATRTGTETTLYIGEDLDFYIKDDTSKTLAATIRSGKLVIRYIPLPTSLEHNTEFTSETDIQPSDLARREIILTSMDDTKVLELQRLGSGSIKATIYYFNKNGSYKVASYDYSITQGWNFIGQGNASTTPDIFLTGKTATEHTYVWVLK